jgi:uncharacterized protein (DUF885 family)
MNIKFSILILSFSMLLFSCNSNEKEISSNKDMDNEFNSFKERFVISLWKQYPEWATSQGYHNYDSLLTIPTPEYRDKENRFVNSMLDSLKLFNLELLSAINKTDFRLIENQLKQTLFYNNSLKSFEWNPSSYNISGLIAEMLAGNYDTKNNRVENSCKRLANAKSYYEAGMANIKNPTKEHTELAIAQLENSVSTFNKDLIDSIKSSTLEIEKKDAYIKIAIAASDAQMSYVNFLKKLKNDTPRSFRIGKALYSEKFNYEINSMYSADEIFAIASKRKQELNIKMAELSKKLWSKYFANKPIPSDTALLIRAMIDKLSDKHVKPENFQLEIEKQIPSLVEYIKKKDLIYIDPSKPLVVRKEPAYMEGVAGASISAPGPYDKNANTYYNVGSLASYKKEDAESYLREYNEYILQILNIHEAIPGHYTQLVYSNNSPSIIKSILGNGTMIEGWAVYGERMMLESGYPNLTGESSDEMWLMYYKWHLRSVCNTILDYSVQCLDMTKEDALKLLIEDAFQQRTEAENKWRRATLTNVQLCCYFTGFTEIYNLREEMKMQQGDKFDLKKWHEHFLSFGSAPVRYIKELMIK